MPKFAANLTMLFNEAPFLERVTNIAMGADINAVVEFEELAERGEDAPTATLAALLD